MTNYLIHNLWSSSHWDLIEHWPLEFGISYYIMPNGQDPFLSPEGVLMMAIAIALDLAGLTMLILSFAGVGIIFSFVLDAIGIIFIAGWILIRSGRIRMTGRALKSLAKKLGPAVLELIPLVGDILFCWTWVVYRELKEEVPEEKGRLKKIKEMIKGAKKLKEK